MSYQNGIKVFVEGDNNNWWDAKDWQKREFIKAMEFGKMKSMGAPNPLTETEQFKCSENGFTYRFIIINDWGPVYIENMDTKKKREIKYIDLSKSQINNITINKYTS